MTQAIPTNVSKLWMEKLTTDEGIDKSTAKTIVTKVAGDPRLMLTTVSSRDDIESTTQVAYEDLGRFDVSETGISEQEWDRIRRDLVDDLRDNLYEQYWETEVPTVDSADELYEILDRAELPPNDIISIVDDVVDGGIESYISSSANSTSSPTAGFGSPAAAKLEEFRDELEDDGTDEDRSAEDPSDAAKPAGDTHPEPPEEDDSEEDESENDSSLE